MGVDRRHTNTMFKSWLLEVAFLITASVVCTVFCLAIWVGVSWVWCTVLKSPFLRKSFNKGWTIVGTVVTEYPLLGPLFSKNLLGENLYPGFCIPSIFSLGDILKNIYHQRMKSIDLKQIRGYNLPWSHRNFMWRQGFCTLSFLFLTNITTLCISWLSLLQNTRLFARSLHLSVLWPLWIF